MYNKNCQKTILIKKRSDKYMFKSTSIVIYSKPNGLTVSQYYEPKLSNPSKNNVKWLKEIKKDVKWS